MAKQHALSCECTKSELDLFSIPPTQTSIVSSTYEEILPMSSVESGAIEFNITTESNSYLDLANSFLYLRTQLVADDDADLAADNFSGPVNNFLHSMFEKVTVTLGDTVITQSANTYPYRAYLEKLASLGEEAKTTQMTVALWYKDSPGHMDSTSCRLKNDQNKPIVANSGLQQRGSSPIKVPWWSWWTVCIVTCFTKTVCSSMG